MTRLILAIALAGLGAAHEAAASQGSDAATISPPRPDMYCSEQQRSRTIARFEVRVAAWRAALENADSVPEMRRAAAYLGRFEEELALVRAAPVYRCTVRLAR